MNIDEWNYDDNIPPSTGWYAVIYSWDSDEGIFTGTNFWLGKEWENMLPIFGWQGPFTTRDIALEWAKQHDPEV